MESVVVLFLAALAVACCEESSAEPPQNQYFNGDVRNCPGKSPQDENQPLYRMEVLPGIGFDNLRNLDMGQVHYYNFSTCQVSKDGKYLLPDSVFLLPVQESKVESYAEYFDHWDNHTSMSSNSINLEASFFSKVSAKFSVDYSTTKSHMYNDDAKSTRVQIRHKLYTVKLQPDAQLHPTFKSRLYDIASNIQNNNTEYAHYLAELTVRDYGTHYVTSMDAGAVLAQTDFIQTSDSSSSEQTIKKIKASASANFFGKVSLSSTFEHDSSATDASDFISSRTHSQVVTIGGPPFTPNMTLTEWESGVANALVAIDRSGDPLHFAITPTTLSALPEHTVRAVSDHVQDAINRYYKVNTHRGCTNPDAENFEFSANLDDSSCQLSSNNYSFGGIYQTCMPDFGHRTEDLCVTGLNPARQVNPITGDFSCPDGYSAVHLHSGSVSHVKQQSVCHNNCHRCHVWKHCCKCDYVLTPFLSIAYYQTYWCAAIADTPINRDQGYLFGGYYSSKVSNPITNSMSCPRTFYPLHMGEDTKICVSTDYEQGVAYAVDFAGFESCSTGNPLAHSAPGAHNQVHWPHLCPNGYAQHLIAIADGCEINFCIRAGAFKQHSLYSPRLPPFRKPPKFKGNLTDTLVMFGVYGHIWAKNDEGGWDQIDKGSDDGKTLIDRLDLKPLSLASSPASSSEELAGGAVAAISVVSTVILGVVIVVAVFVGRKVFKRHRRKKANRHSYVAIGDSANEQEDDAEDVTTNSAQPV